MSNRVFFTILAASSLSYGAGGKPSTPTPAVPGVAEVRILSERVPAGGTVQIKYGFTNPQPILSGGFGLEVGKLNGVSLWSAGGDTAGLGLVRNGSLYISAVSPLADLGLATDYPFLTVTMEVPGTLGSGSTVPLTFSPGSVVTAGGPLSILVKPGTLTVGGNFSIHGVTPGGGTYPAGTIIRIDGKGFLPNAQVKTPQMKISSYKVVSSTEIDFTLFEQTTLDAQLIQVLSGGFTQNFYSYLRGVPVREPTRTLLKSVDPIFQLQTHALARTGPFDAQNAGQYPAMALQNPNPGPAAITLNLNHSDGTVSTSLIVLPSGGRVMDDIAALVGTSSVQQGDVFSLTSTAGIQILGITADETAGSATPFLPAF